MMCDFSLKSDFIMWGSEGSISGEVLRQKNVNKVHTMEGINAQEHQERSRVYDRIFGVLELGVPAVFWEIWLGGD